MGLKHDTNLKVKQYMSIKRECNDNKDLYDLMDDWASISRIIIEAGFETNSVAGKKVVAENLFNMIANWYRQYVYAVDSADYFVINVGTRALDSKNNSLLYQGNVVDFSILDTYVRLLNAQLVYRQEGRLYLFNVPTFVKDRIMAYLNTHDSSSLIS